MAENYISKDSEKQPVKNEDKKQVTEQKQEEIKGNPDNIGDPDISSGVC